MPLNDRRVGKFTIPLSQVDLFPKQARAIMSWCIVVRAETLGAEDCIEYVAISPQFDECTLGQQIPEYVWFFHKTDDVDVVEVNARRVLDRFSHFSVPITVLEPLAP